jgi:DtxR family transcriptional regulator, Mn-dependent transcriptional regulator
MLSFTEENYLKALFKLASQSITKEEVGTNELAVQLGVKPATVNDMLKKLKEKKQIDYEKYGKITLTEDGRKNALEVLRKHRLWETFLYEKLEFTWDEVHEVAEQLEHIQSGKLVDKLEKFLNYPLFDPHGDPIPNAKGEMKAQFNKTLSQLEVGVVCKMVAVKENSVSFLQYVAKLGLSINDYIKVLNKQDYDAMMEIEWNDHKSTISQKFAENILVVCNHCIIGEACNPKHCEIKI